MSITLKAKNNKSQKIATGHVKIGSFIEINPFHYGDTDKILIGKIVRSNYDITGVRDMCNHEIVDVFNSTPCYVIENVEINYKYEHRQYTDKERLDFLNEYGIDSSIECRKGCFIYKSQIDNVSGLRKTIDRIMEYFENK